MPYKDLKIGRAGGRGWCCKRFFSSYDPKLKLGNDGYTLRRAKAKGSSGFIVYKNGKAK